MKNKNSLNSLKQALQDTFEKFGFIYLDEDIDGKPLPAPSFQLQIDYFMERKRKMIILIPKSIITQMLENLMLENNEKKMSDFARELGNTVIGHFLALYVPEKDFTLNSIFIHETESSEFSQSEKYKTVCNLYCDNLQIQVFIDL